MSTKVVIDIPSDEYNLFLDLIGPDPELPTTYEDWVKQRDQRIKILETNGSVANVVTVTHQHFTRYLQDSGFPPSFFTLGAAALSKLHGQPLNNRGQTAIKWPR